MIVGYLVTITARMAQRSQSGERQTGTNRALVRAIRLIVCSSPPKNGGQIHTILNGGAGQGAR
jgi:hypothetical protein